MATRLATAAHQESEWQRRLSSLQLNKAGKSNKRKDLELSAQVWFYKPPDHAKVLATGRKVKHLAHYMGPATITAHIGTNAYKIEYLGKTFQREGGMLITFTQMPASFEINEDEVKRKPRTHHTSLPFREGEFIITKDDPLSTDWYCAEVSQLLPDRIKVNYYTTITDPLEDYATASPVNRTKRLNDSSFLRTWCLQMDGGMPTTRPPQAYGSKETCIPAEFRWLRQISMFCSAMCALAHFES